MPHFSLTYPFIFLRHPSVAVIHLLQKSLDVFFFFFCNGLCVVAMAASFWKAKPLKDFKREGLLLFFSSVPVVCKNAPAHVLV